MKSFLFIQSEQRNIYLVNIQEKSILLVHPLIPYLFYMQSSDKINVLKEQQEYYEKKIQYYKKYGLISNLEKLSKEQFVISKKVIEENLANLNQLTFEVTENCNLKCRYCYYGEYYSTDTDRFCRQLSEDMADNIIDYLSKKQLSNLNKSRENAFHIGFYGGEPLMNIPLIGNIVGSHMDQKFINRKICYSMTTNGTLLDRNISFLVDNNIDITISLDGNKKNNEYRIYSNGDDSFDKVFSNVKLLQKKYPDYFEKNVSFNAVLHNKNSVSDIYNFIQEEFGKIPSIGELNNSGILENKMAEFYSTYRNSEESLKNSENYDKIESELFMNTSTYVAAEIFLHQHLQFVYRAYEELLSGKTYRMSLSTGTCSPFSKRMFVTTEGKILPCEKISHKYVLGNIDKDGVSLDLDKIANRYNSYYDKIYDQCKNCYRQLSCTQCIFFLENLETNPICHGFMNENNFRNYIISNISFMETHSSEYKRMMTEVNIV